MTFVRCLLLGALFVAAPVWGEVPTVVTDIAPVHSLVAIVMGDLGRPDLIVRPGMSAHANALRPSQARALQQGDLVIWMGPGLSPWLRKPVETLAGDADTMVLPDMPGTQLLTYREAGQTGQVDLAKQGPGSVSGRDPHAWLDPENGRTWLGLIADRMAGIDPVNADRYRANAMAGQVEIASLQAEIAAQLAPMQGVSYVTYHDAYQYFESRFGLIPTGAVTPSDATKPSPSELARLREKLTQEQVTCAFVAPQSDLGLLYAAIGRDDLELITLDPLGSTLEPGPQLYPRLLREMGIGFASCVDRN